MAIVYLAEDLKHRRKVAVKVLHPQLTITLGTDRFLKEIEISARLTHPHILPLHDSGEADDFVYYVMPYVEGESLRDRLDREKQLPLEDALSIARDIADGLSYAHQQGVIHQDIKPDNILLVSGHAVIADFGVAGAVSAAGVDGVKHSGRTGGTPEYGSPEQVTGDTVDARSDVYSLGCVLYEMLAGKLPHSGPTAQAIMASRIKNPAPCITRERDDVPDHVVEALETVLAKEPSDRFENASEFGVRLNVMPPQPEWVMRPEGPYLVAGVFIVSSLVVLTLVGILVNALALPNWVLPGAVLLLFIGFPIIIATALVQRGTVRPHPIAGRLFTWRLAIAGGVVALGGWGVLVATLVGIRSDDSPAVHAPAIAVLPLRMIGQDTGATADSSLHELGVAATDWMVRGLSESGLGDVILMEAAASDSDGARSSENQRAMARGSNASLLVTGWLLQGGDSLVMEAVITNLADNRVLDAIGPVVGPAASPMDGVDVLSERVIRSLAALLGLDSTAASSPRQGQN